jgi:general stress protein YciG
MDENEKEILSKASRILGRMGGSVKGVKKGFAAMTPERRSEISRKGGLAPHKKRKVKDAS